MKTRTYILWIAMIVLLTVSNYTWAFTGGFMRSLNDTPWGYTWVGAGKHPVQAGASAQRFELRQGDCGAQPGWSDCLMDRERVEQSQRQPWIPLGHHAWYSWSLYLDPRWPDISPVTTTLGQFHHRDSGTPAILFVQRNGAYWLRIESARSLYPGRDLYKLADLAQMRGRWLDVVIEARFSSGPDGVLRAWVNGQLRAEILGANTLGSTPIFFKYGIYRSFVSRVPQRPTHLAYWDEVRSGATREQVDRRINPQLRPID